MNEKSLEELRGEIYSRSNRLSRQEFQPQDSGNARVLASGGARRPGSIIERAWPAAVIIDDALQYAFETQHGLRLI